MIRTLTPSLLWLGPLLLGCASAPARQPRAPETTLDAIAAALVHNAAQRTDIRGVRACLHAFREENLVTHGPVTTDVDIKYDLVGAELEREFLFALSNRMHVIEAEFAGADREPLEEAGIDATGEAFRASHLIVGDYYHHHGQIVLAVRLIDVDSHVILATARGTLPFAILSDRARERLILPSQRLYRRGVATRASGPVPAEPLVVAADAGLERSYAEWRRRPAFEDTRIDRPWRRGPLTNVLRIPNPSTCSD